MITFKTLLKQTILIQEIKKIYPINQAMEIADIIIDALQEENLQLPSDKENLYKSIQLSDNQKLFKITHNNNRIEDVKMGKVLISLFPNITPRTIQKIVSKIRAINSQDVFEIHDNVSYWYGKVYNQSETYSCMTNKYDLLKFYDYQKNIRILVRYKDGKPYGRALLWTDVYGADNNTYIDRPYPPSDMTNYDLYKNYAKSHGYSFYGDKDNMKLSYQTEKDHTEFPYMDTFRYLDVDINVLYNEYPKMSQHFNIYELDNAQGTTIDEQTDGQDRDELYNNTFTYMNSLYHNDFDKYIKFISILYNNEYIQYKITQNVKSSEQFNNMFDSLSHSNYNYDQKDEYMIINPHSDNLQAFTFSYKSIDDDLDYIREHLDGELKITPKQIAQIVAQMGLSQLLDIIQGKGFPSYYFF